MSLLLNALRKAEKASTQGAAQESSGDGVPGSSRMTRKELTLHLAWVLPAGALIAWLGLHQLGMLPGGEDGQIAAGQVGNVGSNAKTGRPVPRGKPKAQQAAQRPSDPGGRARGKQKTQPATGPAEAETSSEARRKAQRAKRRAERRAAAQSPEGAPPKPVEPAGSQQQATRPPTTPEAQKAAHEAAELAKLEAQRVAQRAADTSGQPANPTTPQQPAAGQPGTAAAAASEDYLGYWQLSADVRNQLPELRISLLVFAEVPADRFVLIDGSRQVEGDILGQGLELQEIRRDGVLFRFRNQRFLVTP